MYTAKTLPPKDGGVNPDVNQCFLYMAFHYEPSLEEVVRNTNTEARKKTKDCSLSTQKRCSDYVEWIQKNRGGILEQRHDDRMMSLLFAADMATECKQQGVQAYFHWHGPHGEIAPRIPKSKRHIRQEFLPLVEQGFGARIHLHKASEEEAGACSTQAPQQLKRPINSLRRQALHP